MVSREQPRLKNAYMLFYERVKKDSTVFLPKPISLVPQHLLKQIREENSQLMKDRQLYDSEYFSFLQVHCLYKLP